MPPSENDFLARWLGPESPLREHLPGFSPRPGQLAMAQAVADCLEREEPLLAEAGTGTGKTLAYLIPVLAAGLKTIISTGTKNLQDQVATKELPLLRKALAPGLKWAVLKGRSNYLCLRRYDAFRAQPDLGIPGAQGGLARLDRWLEAHPSGDLDQARGKSQGGAFWAEVTANAEQCLGAKCPQRDRCRLMEARRQAQAADVVVVNHHLFLADLRLRAEGHGEVLPRYQAVVLDEAHLVPEVATGAFGIAVSQARLGALLKDLGREGPRDGETIAAGAAAAQAGAAFFARLRGLLGPGGRRGLSLEELETLGDPGQDLAEALEDLAELLAAAPGEECETLGQRAGRLGMDLEAAAQPVDGRTVAWAEDQRGGACLHLSPVEVGMHLEHALYQHTGRLVFTSATLAAAGQMGPMRMRLGLPETTQSLVVPSPFDLARQAVLYVPRSMPAPNSAQFTQAVAREVEGLLAHSKGRAFVLFTSHRQLQAVSALLAPRLPYTVLIQGQDSRSRLLERFQDETPAVLFATASFWQGVDVPGEALSAVIVDKLPFAPPDDPLVAARCRRAESQGVSGFAAVSLPEAILSLKQGLGRLLRAEDDRGLLAVLDTRLVTKPYGRRFLQALAPAPLVRDPGQVAAFFQAG